MTLKYITHKNGEHHFATNDTTPLGRVRPTITNTKFRVRQRQPEFVDIGVSVSTYWPMSQRASTVVDTVSLLPVDALKLAMLLAPDVYKLLKDIVVACLDERDEFGAVKSRAKVFVNMINDLTPEGDAVVGEHS